jgi:hypothetical protein
MIKLLDCIIKVHLLSRLHRRKIRSQLPKIIKNSRILRIRYKGRLLLLHLKLKVLQ